MKLKTFAGRAVAAGAVLAALVLSLSACAEKQMGSTPRAGG